MMDDHGASTGGEGLHPGAHGAGPALPADAVPGLALLLAGDGPGSEAVTAALASLGVVCSTARGTREASRLARDVEHDLAIIEITARRDVAAAIGSLAEACPGLACVAVGSGPTPAAVMAAIRAGASDVIDTADAATLRQRLAAALTGARDARARRAREVRIRALCQRLHAAREELGDRVGSLCTDLLGAYRGLSEQLDDVAMASELNGVLRQELEVESLLRTQLEFLLARMGSMNAGIFLPSHSGDYTLGAYINYDLAKETAEATLDTLADTLPGQFEASRRVVHLSDDAALTEHLGDAAGLLSGRSVLAVACHDDAATEKDAECLAVIVLFRRARVGFTEQAVRTLQIAADLFAQQLGRVIRVHHRHLPEDQWGLRGLDGLGEGPQDDADDGFRDAA